MAQGRRFLGRLRLAQLACISAAGPPGGVVVKSVTAVWQAAGTGESAGSGSD
jgi:hypothetical protein